MGHSVIQCDDCGSTIMESRNSWECDCGWTYPKATKSQCKNVKRTDTKYDKFEGSLGEFLESYTKDTLIYYTLSAGYAYKIHTADIKVLEGMYTQGVYIKKQEVWTDHLPVLCWVWDFEGMRVLGVVTKFNSEKPSPYVVINTGCNYKHAVPVTQAEVSKWIWKGK